MKVERTIMKKLLSFIAVFSVVLGTFAIQPTNSAQAAYSPQIEVEALSRNQFRITVTGGYSYAQVDLYNHQSDSELWNGIQNIGTTDRNGKFTTTRTFNSFEPQLAWFWYATVGGRNTPSITTGSRSSNNSSNNGTVLSSRSYNSGTLVLDNGTVYLIYKDQKIGFASERVFIDLGYKWHSVVYGNTSSLPLIYIVTSSVYSHPWGSWIKSGNTIYFVHEDGIIPVSTYSIFKDNGGKPELVVPANWYDMQERKLSKMKDDDSRLE